VGQAQVILVSTTQRDSAFQTEAAQRLEETFRNEGFRVEATQTIGQLRTLIGSIFNVIIIFLMFMALLLGIVGGLGLTGTMSINVLERTREIGVMRAVGASDGAVLRIVLVEGILVGLASWLIGGAFSLPLSKILAEAVGSSLMQTSPSFTFSVGGALGWLFAVIILSAFASFLPARRASSLTVREVLSYE
jgi:putative ABC transport system permease protein